MINWEAVGTIAEVVGAIGVIASLLYVAQQVKSAQVTAADTNRLTRANGVREMFLAMVNDVRIGHAFVKTSGIESQYEAMAAHFDVTLEEAMRADFHNAYYFWLHWGQYSSTNDESGLKELAHIIRSYSTPSIRYSWENSLFAKNALDPDFVKFVDDTLARYDGDFINDK